MKYTKFANITFKLIGLIFLNELIPMITSCINLLLISSSDHEINNGNHLLIFFMGLILHSIIVFVLLFKTDLVLSLMNIVDEEAEEGSVTNMSEFKIGKLSIALMGLYLVSTKLGTSVVFIYQYLTVNPLFSEMQNGLVGNIAANGITLITGVLLILFSKKISLFLFNNKTQN